MPDDALRIEACGSNHTSEGFFYVHAVAGFAPFRWKQPAFFNVGLAEVTL